MNAPAPLPTAALPAPLADPRARDWDETPAEAARYDRAWDANDHDTHGDEDS